LVQG
jgi:hypothetical protein